tara:strand:- start:237 stop:656 length:420 start_codon:yes stop_codon:yes gene_type:complete
MQKHIKRFLNLRIILFMSNLVLKSKVIFAMVIIVNNIHSQNMGELIGSNKHLINQNYKIPGNNEDVIEGLSFRDLKRQQNYNIKHQEKYRKELLKTHLLKQTKPTRKRMKQTLKKSQRLLAGKSLDPSWKVWINRKKIF